MLIAFAQTAVSASRQSSVGSKICGLGPRRPNKPAAACNKDVQSLYFILYFFCHVANVAV